VYNTHRVTGSSSCRVTAGRRAPLPPKKGIYASVVVVVTVCFTSPTTAPSTPPRTRLDAKHPTYSLRPSGSALGGYQFDCVSVLVARGLFTCSRRAVLLLLLSFDPLFPSHDSPAADPFVVIVGNSCAFVGCQQFRDEILLSVPGQVSFAGGRQRQQPKRYYVLHHSGRPNVLCDCSHDMFFYFGYVELWCGVKTVRRTLDNFGSTAIVIQCIHVNGTVERRQHVAGVQSKYGRQ